ncbi:tyrosine-type recombinase/integrase [Levilactobacillus bambusae]|uniref:Integrase n=1 Tax=Levilactobacillus bambusae TaxID=2024736 RepID=A0A2V1MY22_9LACO|nr:tyrosine-type recombinase/integrase [Levilactobacillus bambusae]PWF99682.1 integrase [Levilactobacillus bambusae]
MEYNVQPLRSEFEIQEFIQALYHGKNAQRNYVLVLLGINTGLRMSDILNLTVGQVRGQDQAIIREIKTGKRRWLFLGKLKKILSDYTTEMQDEDPLFPGRDGAMTVNGVYKLFHRAAVRIGRDDIGTHTLRKTFGYHYYRQTHDIATLMVVFNHSSEEITKRYIGLSRDELEASLSQFELGIPQLMHPGIF